MRDFEEFQAALAAHSGTKDSEGEPTYMNSLMNSMSLVLDEFYKHLKAVGVSSMTGDGIPEFFEAVEASREEYERYASAVVIVTHDLMVAQGVSSGTATRPCATRADAPGCQGRVYGANDEGSGGRSGTESERF